MFYKHVTKNKVYMRTLVMLIAVIEITIILVSSILIYSLKKNMLNQLYEIYVEDIKKTIKDTQATIDIIESTSIQMKYDYYIKLLCSYNEPNATQFLPALQQMNNYRRAVSVIDSIYIYNSQTFYISDETAPNFIQTKKDFADKSILSIVDNYRGYDILKPITRKITNLKTGEEKDGCSFLLYDKVPVGPNSIVIINMKNDWLERIIHQMKQLGSTKNLITDNNGNIIVSDEKEKMLNESNEKFVKDIINNPNISGYIIDNVDGVKSLITYTKMPSLNWNYISVTPYKIINKSISGVLLKVLMICALILFLGIGVAVYLSRKFYDPVENLLNKLSEYENQQSDMFNDNKKQFLNTFIFHSNRLQKTFIQKGFEEYNIKLSLALSYILILIKVDESGISSENSKNNDLIKFATYNIVKEMLEPECSTEMIDISEDEILFIVNDDINYEKDREKIEKVLNNTQKLINNYFNFTISAAVSNKIVEFKNLQKALEELKEGAKNRFFYGHGSAIFHEEIERRAKVKYSYPEHKGRDIIAALITGKNEKAKELYMEMVNELKECSYTTFQIYFTFLFWEINQGIRNVKISESNSWLEKLEAFTSEMASSETLDIFNGVVFQIFEGIAESFKNVTSSKHENIAKDIMNIVDNRYNDINLSVECISDCIGFTASYITKIFKQYTGKTIIEYINEKRIENAKILLVESEDSVTAISEKCGFANITYFHRVFKKSVGMTPNLFRNSNSIK